MESEKSVVVRIDGKRIKSSSSKRDSGSKANDEIAAAEETSNGKIHTFAREYDTSYMQTDSKNSKPNKLVMYKPIIIAIISALTIGSIMGLIMLKIIVNFDNDLHSNPALLISDEEKADEANASEGGKGTTANASRFKLEPMTAYVLQAGVFSERSAAESLINQFSNQGFSPVIWEKEGQFFLLIHLGVSKDSLQGEGSALKDKGMEAFVKEWTVAEAEIVATSDEYEWLTSFQDLWLQSVQSGTLDSNSWQELIQKAPEQSDHFSQFISNLDSLHVEGSGESDPGVLLAMWESYYSLVSSEKMVLE